MKAEITLLKRETKETEDIICCVFFFFFKVEQKGNSMQKDNTE